MRGYRAYPNVIAFERFDEGFCHAVALRALDWGKARFEVQGQGDVDRLIGSKDRSVVGQPLHFVRSAAAAEAAFHALDHHIADHLAGDSSCCCQPGDDLAVVAVEDEGHAHDLAIPAGELEGIGTPADIERMVMILPRARVLAVGRYRAAEAVRASSSGGRCAWH